MTVSATGVRAATNGRVPLIAPPRIVFTTESDWVETNEHVIVMACTDPRYQRARKEFIEWHYGLEQYDPIIVPSGPASLLITSLSYAVRRGEIQMLHKEHGFTRAIGIAHLDCRAYKKKYPTWNAEQRRERQFADLVVF